MLISLWQKGQTLVVGSAGASSFFFRSLAFGQQELNNHSREGDQGADETGSAFGGLGQALEDGVQEDLHHSGDDLAKRAAQDHGDSQVNNIAFECKCFKLVQ